MRRLLSFIALVVVFFLCMTVAHADTVTTFALSGELSPFYDSGALGLPTGTVTIDITTGVIEAINLGFTVYQPIGVTPGFLIQSNFEFSEGWYADDPGGNLVAEENITLPVSSLIGYTGGAICSIALQCPGESNAVYLDTSGAFEYGELTPVLTPEPSSFVLLATGMLALVFGLRRGFCG